MLQKRFTIPLAALALIISAGTGVIAVAHADTSTSPTTPSQGQGGRGGQHMRPAAMGAVTAVNGTTITLADKQNGTTYTVDASGATVMKFTAPGSEGGKPTSATINVSDIAVGDMLSVEGTANGSNITATKIADGTFMNGPRGWGPGVMGTVSAVNGSTITVTGKNGTTYTVDGSGAKATKIEDISASDIQVGDSVGVQGTVSGTSVTAKSIMDGVQAQ